MFCRHCGKQLPDNAQFCSGCGKATGAGAQNTNTAAKEKETPRQEPSRTASVYNRQTPQQPASSNSRQVPPRTSSIYNRQSPYQNSGTSQQQSSSYTGQSQYRNQTYSGQSRYSQQSYGGQSQQPYGYGGSPYQQQGGYQKPKKKRHLLLWILAGILILSFVSGLFEDDDDYYDSSYYGHHDYSGSSSSSGGWYSGGNQNSYSGESYSGDGIYSTDLPGSMRGFFTDVDSADDVTVLIYMVGSDLESESGCATSDLIEMANADLSENINVLIQTGGTSSWNNNVMSDGQVERWILEDGGDFNRVDSLGRQTMLSSDALSDFIKWGKNTCPADRYILIFWDHGGGSLYGYGYDELFPDESMFLNEIVLGVRNGGVQFDIIGFDACLMATVETAYALEPYADYLIASEETEPGSGWYYTNWLSELADDPSMDSVELGRIIVDDFIEDNSRQDTLSVTSLREVPRIYDALCMYLSKASDSVLFQNYNVISTARANSKSYADGEYDLVDIVDFTSRVDLLDCSDLKAAIASAVKYRNNCSLRGSYGLSMYFPYSDISVYSYAKAIFSQIGYADECTEFFDSFVSIMANGRVQTTRTVGTGETEVQVTENTEEDYGQYDWYDPDMEFDHSTTTFDVADRLEIVENKDGDYILELTDDDWNIITSIRVEAMYDDGEGYIYLGSDQYFELDEKDNLIVNFDNTWVAINDQIVVYYAAGTYLREDDTYVFTGIVPAVLNDETEIEILLKYDNDRPYGYVEGYRIVNDETQTFGRTCLQFKEGDTIDFICTYYQYDGTYDDEYYISDRITYHEETGLTLSYEDVGSDPVLICYRISDIYGNDYWTEEVLYQ